MAHASGALAREEAVLNRISLPLLRIQERRLLLTAVDSIVVAGVMAGSYELWRNRVHPASDNMATMPWAWVLGAAAVWTLLSWLAGAYDLATADRLARSLRATLTVTLLSAVTGFAAGWIFEKTYPRPALVIAMVGAPAAVLCWRTLYGIALKRPVGVTRMVVVGAREYSSALTTVAAGSPYHRVVGFLSESGSGEGALGPASHIDSVLDRFGVHRIVVAPRLRLSDSIVSGLTRAIERGVEVVDFNSAYEEIADKVAVEHVGDQWLAALPTRPSTSSIEEAGIRLLDLVGAIVGLGLVLILAPFIAAAIMLTSPGPLLYRQRRVGRSGIEFTLYKFRSMATDAEAGGARWADVNDSRATRVGAFLRRTHLDELPQFWNVLRGDMSLVGPRPERPEFTASLSESIPFYRLRLSVRPGMTGQKQLKVGYAASVPEHLEVLRHDLYYLKHRSVALNILIIGRTFGMVLGRRGR